MPGCSRNRQRRSVISYLPTISSGMALFSLVVIPPAHKRKGIALLLLAAAESACKTDKLFTSTNAQTSLHEATHIQG